MADAIFSDPRLAGIYDALDADRSDLDVYVALIDELGAHRVVDIGCGTGTFACTLAQRGRDVIGVDPAGASLDVARRKPGAARVRWLEGDASGVPALEADAVTMTGNVAQVFLTDDDWSATLHAAGNALRAGGWLVFEAREPSRRAWEGWTRGVTERSVDVADVGLVDTWIEVIDVQLPLVSFRHTYAFRRDGTILTSDSTVRFRTRGEIEDALDAAGFDVRDVRDAPDRPGLELVFLAHRRRGARR